jgi:hypothetical protein
VRREVCCLVIDVDQSVFSNFKARQPPDLNLAEKESSAEASTLRDFPDGVGDLFNHLVLRSSM